jgi:hypothetical protein
MIRSMNVSRIRVYQRRERTRPGLPERVPGYFQALEYSDRDNLAQP